MVIHEIAKCEHILSSSLHGLVVADALGIPNGWIKLSDRVVGDGFKFKDYGTAIKRKHSPIFINGNEILKVLIKSTTIDKKRVNEVKSVLDIALCNYFQEINS